MEERDSWLPRGRRMEKMTLDSTFSIGNGGWGCQGVGGPKAGLGDPFPA